MITQRSPNPNIHYYYFSSVKRKGKKQYRQLKMQDDMIQIHFAPLNVTSSKVYEISGQKPSRNLAPQPDLEVLEARSTVKKYKKLDIERMETLSEIQHALENSNSVSASDRQNPPVDCAKRIHSSLSQSLDLSAVERILEEKRLEGNGSQNSVKTLLLTPDSSQANITSSQELENIKENWVSKVCFYGEPQDGTTVQDKEQSDEAMCWFVEHKDGFWFEVGALEAESDQFQLESLPNYWTALEWKWEKTEREHYGFPVWSPKRK